jgi:ABC-2 type transport system permease protein
VTTLTPHTQPARPTAGTSKVGPLLRILRIELRDELLAIVREPAALFFSMAMPVAFYALFVGLWGDQMAEATAAPTTVATSMLATFGTFGVLGVTLFNPGVGVADDRERGWLRAKLVSATPLPVTLTAKCLATVPYSLAVLLAMTGVAFAYGYLDVEFGVWVRLVAVLTVGALPFGLIGLAVGLRFSPNAATAILQALLIPMAVASGLWFPLEQLPAFIQGLAPGLPAYHLARLALAQVDGGAVGMHVVALGLTTVVAAVVAGLAYRHART